MDAYKRVLLSLLLPCARDGRIHPGQKDRRSVPRIGTERHNHFLTNLIHFSDGK